MMDMMMNHPLILKDPAPFVALETCGDSALNFVVRAWCKNSDYWTVHFDLTAQSTKLLEENGIEIPFPQMDVHIK